MECKDCFNCNSCNSEINKIHDSICSQFISGNESERIYNQWLEDVYYKDFHNYMNKKYSGNGEV